MERKITRKDRIYTKEEAIQLLIQDNYAYLKTLIQKKIKGEIMEQLLEEYEYQDILQEFFVQIMIGLEKYNPNKSEVKTYIINYINTDIMVRIKKLMYNKLGIVVYKDYEYRMKGFKDLIHIDTNRKSKENEYYEIKEQENNIKLEEIEYVEEDKEIFKKRQEISLIIKEMIPKYGEQTINKFEEWFYNTKKNKNYGIRYTKLFEELYNEIKEKSIDNL